MDETNRPGGQTSSGEGTSESLRGRLIVAFDRLAHCTAARTSLSITMDTLAHVAALLPIVLSAYVLRDASEKVRIVGILLASTCMLPLITSRRGFISTRLFLLCLRLLESRSKVTVGRSRVSTTWRPWFASLDNIVDSRRVDGLPCVVGDLIVPPHIHTMFLMPLAHPPCHGLAVCTNTLAQVLYHGEMQRLAVVEPGYEAIITTSAVAVAFTGASGRYAQCASELSKRLKGSDLSAEVNAFGTDSAVIVFTQRRLRLCEFPDALRTAEQVYRYLSNSSEH